MITKDAFSRAIWAPDHVHVVDGALTYAQLAVLMHAVDNYDGTFYLRNAQHIDLGWDRHPLQTPPDIEVIPDDWGWSDEYQHAANVGDYVATGLYVYETGTAAISSSNRYSRRLLDRNGNFDVHALRMMLDDLDRRLTHSMQLHIEEQTRVGDIVINETI